MFTYTKILVYLVGKSWNLIFMLFHVHDLGWFLHTWFLHVRFFFFAFVCMIIISSWKLFLCTFTCLILYDFLMHDFIGFFVCGARFYVGRPVLMTRSEKKFFEFEREFFGELSVERRRGPIGPSWSAHGYVSFSIRGSGTEPSKLFFLGLLRHDFYVACLILMHSLHKCERSFAWFFMFCILLILPPPSYMILHNCMYYLFFSCGYSCMHAKPFFF